MNRQRWKKRLGFGIGLLVGLLAFLMLGELYLRWFPPSELQDLLGEQSLKTGPFQPDAHFGVQYQSWQKFQTDYAQWFQTHPYPPSSDRPVWVMFGNSFVNQAGMLADTAKEQLTQIHILNFQRNEPFSVRLAQIPLLLENGLKPQRIFIALLPLDFWPLHEHSVKHTTANSKGAITYLPRIPSGPLGWLVRYSRLGMIGWMRSKLHYSQPLARPSQMIDVLCAEIRSEIQMLFTEVHRITQQHGVTVTILLIPNHGQIVKGLSFGLQDDLKTLLTSIGLDVCDTRQVFLEASDKPSLFIPDKHFSRRGNLLLLDGILKHLQAQGINRDGMISYGKPNNP